MQHHCHREVRIKENYTDEDTVTSPQAKNRVETEFDINPRPAGGAQFGRDTQSEASLE